MMEINFFTEHSPYFDHPLLTADRTARELDFILSELQLPAGAYLLDVGCGFGRHSLALAQRGFKVTGMDPSPAMISAAEKSAAAIGVTVGWLQMRAETFAADPEYDAAICLFNTLGQITPAGENSGLIDRVYAALKPGSRFVIEVPQLGPAVNQLKPTEKIGGDEYGMEVTRRFDPADKTVTETFTRTAPDRTQVFTLRYRLFSRTELAERLKAAGFTIRTVYAGYESAPLEVDSPVMVFFASKPQGEPR